MGLIGDFGILRECDQSVVDMMHRTVEEHDSSLIYVHVPFSTDRDRSEGYDRLKSFVSDLMTDGRTCIVADVCHTD